MAGPANIFKNLSAVHLAVGVGVGQKEEGTSQDSRTNMSSTMGVKKTCVKAI